MQKTIINFRTNQSIKQKAQKKAEQMGVSLSAILNLYLQQFNADETAYAIPEELELKWLNEDEETLKKEKRFSSVDALMDELMK